MCSFSATQESLDLLLERGHQSPQRPWTQDLQPALLLLVRLLRSPLEQQGLPPLEQQGLPPLQQQGLPPHWQQVLPLLLVPDLMQQVPHLCCKSWHALADLLKVCP